MSELNTGVFSSWDIEFSLTLEWGKKELDTTDEEQWVDTSPFLEELRKGENLKQLPSACHTWGLLLTNWSRRKHTNYSIKPIISFTFLVNVTKPKRQGN